MYAVFREEFLLRSKTSLRNPLVVLLSHKGNVQEPKQAGY